MRRDDALLHWHAETLNGFLNQVDHLIHHPAKYLDPDFSREPSTGKTLYERAKREADQIVRDLPGIAASSVPPMAYRFPTNLGESLNREELRRFREDIEALVQILSAGGN